MDHDDDIDTSHPWLVIPYFNGDEGRAAQRPLTKVLPPVTSWLCPSIHVQGVNYSTPPGTYLPDEALAITVAVDNRGVPNALVKLRLYWSDPATGFANPQLILSATRTVPDRAVPGPTSVPAPSRSVRRSANRARHPRSLPRPRPAPSLRRVRAWRESRSQKKILD